MSDCARQLSVHLYALCWNEERLLPFFFRHYDPFVTRYFIFDHDSTDRSCQLLKAHSRVALGNFEGVGTVISQVHGIFTIMHGNKVAALPTGSSSAILTSISSIRTSPDSSIERTKAARLFSRPTVLR